MFGVGKPGPSGPREPLDMKRHGRLNRAYRLVWSDRLQTWTVAAETAKSRGKQTFLTRALRLLA